MADYRLPQTAKELLHEIPRTLLLKISNYEMDGQLLFFRLSPLIGCRISQPLEKVSHKALIVNELTSIAP